MKRFFTNFIKDESGQDLVEYALLLSVLALAGIATIGTIATTIAADLAAANVKITAS